VGFEGEAVAGTVRGDQGDGAGGANPGRISKSEVAIASYTR